MKEKKFYGLGHEQIKSFVKPKEILFFLLCNHFKMSNWAWPMIFCERMLFVTDSHAIASVWILYSYRFKQNVSVYYIDNSLGKMI